MAYDLEGVGAGARQFSIFKVCFIFQKRKRLAHPRQAQDEPHRKAFFAFLEGLDCDLEGVGAEARQFSTLKLYFLIFLE
ncbi:hypothetical protein C1N70_00340 [Cytobacillus firmus]